MIYGVDYERQSCGAQIEPEELEVIECQGCNARGVDLELTWIGNDWDFYGCPACVRACREAELKETGCTAAEIAAAAPVSVKEAA